MSNHVGPNYLRVFWTLVRNSLVRDMTFRSNFLIECLSSFSWVLMNLGFYLLIFAYTQEIGRGSGWGKYEFFVFLATTMFINSVVQAFFMPNAQEFSELIRSGSLDFALLKPIDTQFLVSLKQVDWSALANFVVGLGLLGYSLFRLTTRPEDPLRLTPMMPVWYVFYLGCGVAIMYSLMISLAATSIWLGRNQTLYNFWFYITNFSRYPMEIYSGTYGEPLRFLFTFLIPVLVVVNVPARIMALPLRWQDGMAHLLPAFAVVATVVSLVGSRWVFQRALGSYRSASS
ncbi:MAG: ABC-2 family transporter protein [Planctomycetales bacterium]|nr:ABC-2 family transporter protein [Planctomycetales bacterium]